MSHTIQLGLPDMVMLVALVCFSSETHPNWSGFCINLLWDVEVDGWTAIFVVAFGLVFEGLWAYFDQFQEVNEVNDLRCCGFGYGIRGFYLPSSGGKLGLM